MSVGMNDWGLVPGPQAARETAESNFLWNRGAFAVFQNGIVIDSACTDNGNSTTTQLRAGLLMGKITSSSKYTGWSPTATDGSQVVVGVLSSPQNMLDFNGSAADRIGVLVVGGCVKNAKLYSNNSGTNLDRQARQQMRGRFIFDDDNVQRGGVYPFIQEITKTANYTVLATENGALYDNAGATGAVVFTLPTIANGLVYGFSVQADQSVTVNSAAGDDIIVPNDASADSVAASTVGDKVGALWVLYTNPAGTKWILDKRCSNALTFTT